MPLNLTLLKGCQIVGVFWGAWTGMFPAENQKNFEELFQMYKDGKINPAPSDKFTLETSAEAIAHLKDRKAKGKVIKKLVIKIPIKTISELKLKKVIGPSIVKAIDVMIHKIMMGGL